MAIFVLIHGGGHGGWCYQPVARLLQKKGHIVYAPSLTGLADRSHLLSADIDLDTHITDVEQLLFYEDLHHVILVGHSYGGMVITGAADRAVDRVGHRVYLDAAYPRDNESLLEHAGPMISAARQAGRVVDGVELVQFPEDAGPEFYGITDPEHYGWAKARLTPQPWKCFEQKLRLTNEAAMRAIPESHLICTSTIPGRDMPLLTQRAQGRVWDIDTGHDLMLTEPTWVADKLAIIAG
jgi:pimeloyl-ACP methyl ester carboxylesterase